MAVSDDHKVVWGKTPKQVEHETHYTTEWCSVCGRYKICHLRSKYGSHSYYAAVRVVKLDGIRDPQQYLLETQRQEDGRGMGNYVKQYHRIEDALRSVERYHTKKFGNCFTNREKFLASLLTESVQSERKEQQAEKPEETSEQKVLKALGEKSKSADELAQETGIKTIRVLLLKMRKLVFRTGKVYSLKGKV